MADGTLELLYYVIDSGRPSIITILSSKIVDNLKEAIIAKQHRRLKDAMLSDLTLWKTPLQSLSPKQGMSFKTKIP